MRACAPVNDIMGGMCGAAGMLPMLRERDKTDQGRTTGVVPLTMGRRRPGVHQPLAHSDRALRVIRLRPKWPWPKQGNSIKRGTPEPAAQYFRSEMTRYTALAKSAAISLDCFKGD